ncbi:MAG: hypothetical protein UW08_C0007G0001 [Parcubacteria group bacterium GW2011_GWB1_43_8b]|nr:MAG: hypothetical protein UW08_C0007G0001 [Parcubacteria group bacterium GW2011_GWB1_43_8b]
MQNCQLTFSPRKPYNLVAERSEATAPYLQFPVWWTRGELNPYLCNAPRSKFSLSCGHYTTKSEPFLSKTPTDLPLRAPLHSDHRRMKG